ncbi:QueT transporter family protein [Enterococcus sp. DIV0242_7C1]|uniref:Integral membrane protein n=1 Tax=Candidatus Enterococcus dunnyi TaxID=1834192 RepID=A0A200JCP2_9ENTE|nr:MULTISPECIES: QueT transporter family protein [unclassified Enterococcus]MBO0469747.1 QueT transporter family protein [Enterococcus sp. DIV0242_7C1]MCA5011725.1 QueT transporter family protein [Enterococcus sp. S23]MCA5014833.1 QueT transporter family protein [Enterococcus sp. S22(2020)]OUZ34964.1 hypothetical protein A5889_000439 [Enterococcus sp. 9D6_DIV0238]
MQKTVTTNSKVKVITMNSIVMALYLALTLLVAPVSSGPIQFRISESLNHLVVFNRKLMWGVLGGVIVYNFFFGFGAIDALYGGMQSFISLGLTALLYKKVPNVMLRLALNTVFFTATMCIIAYMLAPQGGAAFWGNYATLALSEFVTMAVAAPIMYWINKSVHFEKRA